MATVYIIYSEKLDRFYTGSCKDFDSRFKEHLNKTFKSSFTAQTDDWIVFLTINNLNYNQARNIESHIKRMKSKIYIQNLKRYPDIINKLIIRYS